jgi:hypothetical protein
MDRGRGGRGGQFFSGCLVEFAGRLQVSALLKQGDGGRGCVIHLAGRLTIEAKVAQTFLYAYRLGEGIHLAKIERETC